MSVGSNSVIAEKNLNKMTDLAFRAHCENKPDYLNSAIQVLNRCGLNAEQNAKIAGILGNVPSDIAVDATESMKRQIVTVLNGGLAPQLDLAIPVVCDDAFATVFSFSDPKKEMSTFSSVCHRWHDFVIPQACKAQLSMKVSLTMGDLEIYHKRLGGNPGNWDCVFSHCKQLKALDFSNAFQISRDEGQQNEICSILASAKQYCPNLIDLNFSMCYAVADKTLAFLRQNFPNLTHLNLRFCKYGPEGIHSLILGCSNLISLNLSNGAIGNNEIILIAENCPKLCYLNLNDSNTFATGPVTDASITVLAEKCPFLTHLMIPESKITDVSLLALGKHCKGFVYFYHYSCYRFTGGGLDALCNLLPNLVTSDNLDDEDKF